MNNPPPPASGNQTIDPAILAYAQQLQGGAPAAPAQPALPPGVIAAPPNYNPNALTPNDPGYQDQAIPYNPPAANRPVPAAGPAGARIEKAMATPNGQFLPGPGAGAEPGAAGGFVPGQVNLGGGGGTIPAHEVPLTNPKYQGELPKDLDMQKALEAEQGSFEGQKEAAKKEAEAESDVSKATAAGLRGEADAASSAAEQYKTEALVRKAELKPYEEKYANAIEEASKHQINPSRLWANMGTFDRVRMGLASIVGGFYAGWTGRADPVQEKITRMIQMDVDAQKADYEMAKDKAEAQRSLYSIARDQGLDEKEASNMAIRLGLDQAKTQTAMLAAQAGSPLALARGDQTIAKLNTEELKYGPTRVEAKMKENKWVPPASAGGGVDMKAVRKDAADFLKAHPEATPQQAMAQAMYIHGAYRPAQGPGSEHQFYVKPEKGAPANAAAAAKAQDAIQSANEIIRINNRLNELATAPGVRTAAERAEMDQLIRNGQLHYARMQTGSTRINEKELEAGQRTYAGEGDWYRGDPLGRQKARLDVITQQARARLAEAAEQLGSAQKGGGAQAEEKSDEDLGITP